MFLNLFNFIPVRMELSKLSCINVTYKYVTGCNSVSVVKQNVPVKFHVCYES